MTISDTIIRHTANDISQRLITRLNNPKFNGFRTMNIAIRFGLDLLPEELAQIQERVAATKHDQAFTVIIKPRVVNDIAYLVAVVTR